MARCSLSLPWGDTCRASDRLILNVFYKGVGVVCGSRKIFLVCCCLPQILSCFFLSCPRSFRWREVAVGLIFLTIHGSPQWGHPNWVINSSISIWRWRYRYHKQGKGSLVLWPPPKFVWQCTFFRLAFGFPSLGLHVKCSLFSTWHHLYSPPAEAFQGWGPAVTPWGIN
jgi:hypothetical protein